MHGTLLLFSPRKKEMFSKLATSNLRVCKASTLGSKERIVRTLLYGGMGTPPFDYIWTTPSDKSQPQATTESLELEPNYDEKFSFLGFRSRWRPKRCQNHIISMPVYSSRASTSKVAGLPLNTVELEQDSEPVESGKIRMLLESPTIRLEPPLSNLIR